MTPSQCRAARALIDLTQPKLAETAGIGLSTVVDFERSRRSVSSDAAGAIQRALEAAGVEFTNGDQPGVKMKAGHKPVPAEKPEFTPFARGEGVQTDVGNPRPPRPRGDDE